MNTKVVLVSNSLIAKIVRTRIRLWGKWLEDIGFEKESLIKIIYRKGKIELIHAGKGMEDYFKIKKEILKDPHSGVLEVGFIRNAPVLLIKSKCLNEMNFSTGTVAKVHYQNGYILLEALELPNLT
jgi:hypothetical protein